MNRTILTAAALAACLAAPALAQTKPAAPAAQPDVKKAVACQTLLIQFNDAVGPSKAADDVKKTAREQSAAGNKACNEKSYDVGMDQIRQALGTLSVKPLL